MILTKKEFWDLVNNNQIDIRPTDECYYNGVKYLIKCDDVNNVVELEIKMEVEEVKCY